MEGCDSPLKGGKGDSFLGKGDFKKKHKKRLSFSGESFKK